ncbi:transcription antitermination factor NusB [Luteipulveratus flavus]|uniref:Transcription antitermination factor NusB n=1 Tax=Luteipulveratus flavus TaxID=3031728 RepID=A0ABT6C5Y9_9MICO|nr:transcription antitermination factor NusB [Luteipulveratus sp. YIM 133296]MDF8264141.1 transcription antitermination factor NusB [Luteipulveratus sp. YIM 133296]
MADDSHERGFRNARGRQRPDVRRSGNRSRSASRPAERRREGDPARRAAYDVMRAVERGAYANLELPRILRNAGLTGRDAAFATELTYGAIRMHGLYDPVIELAAGRPVGQIDPPVLATARLGVHQLLGMRVPPHAAASETVALARSVNGAGAAGFVNAVLRRASERSREEWVAEVTAGRERADALAVEYSHPVWVVRALRSALLGHGASDAEAVDADLVGLLAADNDPPRVSLVARPGLADVGELLEAGAEASELSPVGAVLPGGDPASIAAVRQTRAAVQDEGSQLLALALAAAHVDDVGDEGEQWLDLCAGPGGKSALLAVLAQQQGAVLFANEVSEHRTELVRSTLRAAIDAGAEVMIGTGDGRDLGQEEPDTYDRVLVDAPCTGLGALRRRPEARWRRSASDVSDLAALQRELLTSAIDATRPGGVIGYATCSPHLAETTTVVADVLGGRSDVVQEDARPLFRDARGAQVDGLGDGPSVQLWPHLHGTDAMFFALIRKTAP